MDFISFDLSFIKLVRPLFENRNIPLYVENDRTVGEKTDLLNFLNSNELLSLIKWI